MMFDLHCHELEVVKAFFARGVAWAATESVSESIELAKIDQPDSETVENVIFSPHGAHEFEQMVFRSVINELNSLCEFALQNTLMQLSGTILFLTREKLIFSLTRDIIEGELNNESLGDKRIDVNKCSTWLEIKKIKELSEGFKHRQRLQPFLPILDSRKRERGMRFVDPENENWLSPYENEHELTSANVSGYIDSVDKLFLWLGPKCSWWM